MQSVYQQILKETLRDFILDELSAPSADGYRFPRLNHFIGKRMRFGGWYPDHVLRLFDRNKGRFGGINPHDKVIIDNGKISTGKIALIHYTYSTLDQYLAKQNFYSSIAANVKFNASKKYTFIPVTLFVKTFWKFFEVYVLKRGALDGTHGFVAAFGSACLTFWKYAKIWELSRNRKSK